MKKFTILVPLYNHEESVADCLKSIQAQSFTDFECIALDDGSEDSTYSLAKNAVKGDSRFKFSKRAHKGIGKTLNDLLEKAEGEYTVIVDCDDTITEDCLKALNACIEKFPEADFVCGSLKIRDEDILVHNSNDIAIMQKNDLLYYSSYKYLLLLYLGKAIKTKFLKDNSLKFKEDLLPGVDLVFVLEVLLAADMYVKIQDVIYHKPTTTAHHKYIDKSKDDMGIQQEHVLKSLIKFSRLGKIPEYQYKPLCKLINRANLLKFEIVPNVLATILKTFK